MNNNKIYKPINSIGDLNELKISVDYELGGMNYFSGEINKRGTYVYFKPVCRGDGFETTMLLADTASAGFKIFVKEQGRKSAKTVNAVFEAVKPYADTFAELYNKRQFTGIMELVLNATKGI